MAYRDLLRKTIITGGAKNVRSKHQEKTIDIAVRNVIASLYKNYNVQFFHAGSVKLKEIVMDLKNKFPEIEFTYLFESSSMRPDGGILFLRSLKDELYPILITEVKQQGTNDLLAAEGKPKQAKGNAIERLGKNVIGFRTALISEAIFPFVCFGYGCDFDDASSILDRVVTIAMFGKLNKTYLHNEGLNGVFNRGSFYFRKEEWTIDEMQKIMYDIAEKSIFYYFSKYGKKSFLK